MIIASGPQAMIRPVRVWGHLKAVAVLTLTWMPADLRAEPHGPVVDVIKEHGGVRIKANATGRLDVLKALSLELGIDPIYSCSMDGIHFLVGQGFFS